MKGNSEKIRKAVLLSDLLFCYFSECDNQKKNSYCPKVTIEKEFLELMKNQEINFSSVNPGLGP